MEDRPHTNTNIPGNTDMFVSLADWTARWLSEAQVMRVRNTEFLCLMSKEEEKRKKKVEYMR